MVIHIHTRWQSKYTSYTIYMLIYITVHALLRTEENLHDIV